MRQIDPTPRPVNIEGYVLPWDRAHNRVIIVTIEGTRWLPIFPTAERLREALSEYGYAPESISIKQISDVADFLSRSLDAQIGVALDPHRVDGRVRFGSIIPQGLN